MNKILITGANGQDGTNLIKYLLSLEDSKKFEIYATVRNLNLNKYLNKFYQNNKVNIFLLDLGENENIINIFKKIMPDYFINLAGQSSVSRSWKDPAYTIKTNTLAVVKILDIIKEFKPKCKFFNAGSSEEFGEIKYSPQDINHPKNPKSPYAISKSTSHDFIKLYRKVYNLFAVHTILYNHEGILRGKQFVTRKITSNIAKIKKDLKNKLIPKPLELGNLNTIRDFGDSEEYVELIWKIINKDFPEDYIISNNQLHTLSEFIDLSFKYAEIPIIWFKNDNDLDTKIYLNRDKFHIKYSQDIILLKINKNYHRPIEVDNLKGDNTKLKLDFNWTPKISFENLVKKMIDNDINLS